MSKNERITDFFIGKLLDDAKILYTPNGSDIKEIQTALKTASKKGTNRVGFPEFTAKVEDFIIVIENKADEENQAAYDDEKQTKLSTSPKALANYAENGALHYAQQIIQKTTFKKVFAFGCSGDEKHHTIRPIFVDEYGYRLLPRVENFTNFTKGNILNYYKQQVLGETPSEEKELQEILSKAKELHEFLRNYGQLGDSEKPLVVSAILLALSEKTFNIDNLTGDDQKTDGQILFDYISTYMDRVKVTPSTKKEKVLSQFTIIRDRAILNQVDERLKQEVKKENYLAKTPLRFFTEYIRDNILHSVKANTAEDVLGRFYGEFISFSGGDGQTLGVVLTPKHITELFCDLVNIKPTDKVFDPCCGTSGFLIAGMHKMLELADDEVSKNRIKKEQLHGIEIREDMFSIATTNMILRGDGKSNLENRDFLKVSSAELRKNNFTVGFINPPYSQAKNKETSHLSEISFIKHLLDSLSEGAKCVAIVPPSTMVGKRLDDKKLKAQILESHTLEGVLTLNKNTFYRVGTSACIAVFTAHVPHNKNKRSKFINFEDDGFVVSKHVGLTPTQRALEKKQALLDWWFDRKDVESRYMVKTTVEPDDEWLHSFYYFNDEIPKEQEFEKILGDYLTFEFDMISQGRSYLFDTE